MKSAAGRRGHALRRQKVPAGASGSRPCDVLRQQDAHRSSAEGRGADGTSSRRPVRLRSWMPSPHEPDTARPDGAPELLPPRWTGFSPRRQAVRRQPPRHPRARVGVFGRKGCLRPLLSTRGQWCARRGYVERDLCRGSAPSRGRGWQLLLARRPQSARQEFECANTQPRDGTMRPWRRTRAEATRTCISGAAVAIVLACASWTAGNGVLAGTGGVDVATRQAPGAGAVKTAQQATRSAAPVAALHCAEWNHRRVLRKGDRGGGGGESLSG